MSIASRMFLAAVFAAGLAVPGGAHAAVQGFSIALTDMTLAYDPAYPGNIPDLSATAAAFGGMPAFPLPHNGSYTDTLTGDYAVFDNLPPLTESIRWREFYQITLNGRTLFENHGLLGPVSANDIINAFLMVTGLKPAAADFVLRVLEMNSNLSLFGGKFDYAYNFAPDDRAVGTFAVGSTEDLVTLLGLPYKFPAGTNQLSFAFSIFAVPEPPTWLMLMAGGAGLLVIRALARRRAPA
jgi:hypothetical protein